MHDLLRGAILDALAVLVPVECAGCGRADRALCPACRAACSVTPGAPAAGAQVLRDGTPILSALRYDGAVRAAILAFKEGGRTDVTRPLALALTAAIEAAATMYPATEATALGFARQGVRAHPALELCPVPATRSGQRRRGYRPVELLVRAAGFRPERVLLAAAPATRQKTLGRQERGHNLQGSMRAAHPLDGRRFILIDDVVTTGATLAEAARAVHEAGGEVAACATLAFTPLLIPLRSTPAGPTRDIHRIDGYGV